MQIKPKRIKHPRPVSFKKAQARQSRTAGGKGIARACCARGGSEWVMLRGPSTRAPGAAVQGRPRRRRQGPSAPPAPRGGIGRGSGSHPPGLQQQRGPGPLRGQVGRHRLGRGRRPGAGQRDPERRGAKEHPQHTGGHCHRAGREARADRTWRPKPGAATLQPAPPDAPSPTSGGGSASPLLAPGPARAGRMRAQLRLGPGIAAGGRPRAVPAAPECSATWLMLRRIRDRVSDGGCGTRSGEAGSPRPN